MRLSNTVGSGEVLQQKPCSNQSDVDTPDMVLRPNAIVERRADRVSVTTVGAVPVALAKENAKVAVSNWVTASARSSRLTSKLFTVDWADWMAAANSSAPLWLMRSD